MNEPDIEAALIHWLGGIRPAWGLLPPEIMEALLAPEPFADGPVRLAGDLPLAAFGGSLLLRHARLVLAAIDAEGGIKLTAKNNLGRAFVAQMVEAFDWPDYGREEVYRFNKVINEPDFLPLHLLHILLREARLVRRLKGRLLLSRKGRALLTEDTAGALQLELFETVFGDYNLAYLDGFPGDDFPQNQIGLVLFLLGQTAAAWRSPDDLVRLAALPDGLALDVIVDPPARQRDWAGLIFEARLLRYLYWFGLLERRPEPADPPDPFPQRREYKKTALFDRFIAFELPGVEAGTTLN